MPKPVLRFIVLMLIMLNHAVSACESIVMHLPDDNHPFSVLDSGEHNTMPLHQHGALDLHSDLKAQSLTAADQAAESGNETHHSTHAHVACYIAELYAVSADPLVHKATGVKQYALITTTYSPPVPPPNH